MNGVSRQPKHSSSMAKRYAKNTPSRDRNTAMSTTASMAKKPAASRYIP